MTGSEGTAPPLAPLAEQLLGQILAEAHPLLAEGLMLAALPHSYDAPLLAALRARADGRDERLAARLAEFSFVERLPDGRWRVAQGEREWLHRHFQRQGADGYRAAHRRALDYLSAHPLADPFSQDQALLFHGLLCDPVAGMARYEATARLYIINHQLAALERLIATAREGHALLATLEPPPAPLSPFSDYLSARLLQLRGEWAESLPRLQRFLADPTFPPSLRPLAQRAQGLALATQERYMDAVASYHAALRGFHDAGEQGETMLHIGDAYRDLAIAARGHHLLQPPPPRGLPRLQSLLGALLALPVLLYYAFQGFNISSLSLWESQAGQDWLLARLFGMAAHWYRRADRLLDALPQRGATTVPDERLADLMLTVGDARGALSRFDRLRDDPALRGNDYRRAVTGLGRAQALLRLGQADAAQQALAQIRPLLVEYQDQEALATSELLLGDMALRADGPLTAENLAHFERALAYYRDQGDTLAMTEIAERLEVAAEEAPQGEARAALLALAATVTERSYRVRFRHSLVLLFQRLSLAFIALVLFLIPMVTLDPQPPTLLDLRVVVDWDPQAAFDPLNVAATPSIQPSGPPTLRLSAALGATVALVLGYLAAQLLLGLLLILFTQSREIEREVQREQLYWGKEAIRVGADAPGLPWGTVREGIGAEMRLGRSLLRDNSGLLLRGAEGGELWIPGQTARYEALRARLAGRWPEREIGYSLLYSRMGALYLAGLIVLVGTILLNRLSPALTNQPLLGPYSLVQLYPFAFLLLMVPTLWWAALRPLRMYLALDRLAPLIGWVAGSGILLALARLLTPGRAWFIYPDIYPSLIALWLLASASLALWLSRHDPPGPLPSWRSLLSQPHPLRLPRALRYGLIGLMLLLLLPSALRLGRDLLAYHAWVQGHAALLRSLTAGSNPSEYAAATAAYERALRLDPHHRLALQGLAAVQTKRGDYDAARTTFERALAVAPDRQSRGYLLADRAALFAQWSLATTDEARADTFWANAQRDASEAYRLVPSAPFEQRRGEAALVGGWISYRRGHYEAALDHFEQAAAAHAPPADVALGRGYALYKLGRYDDAYEAWSEAIRARPDDALAYAARAVAIWQVARHAEPSLCEDGEALPETVQWLEAGLRDLEQSLALKPLAFTYRTASQFHYLLRGCPGHERLAEYDAAIAGYERAASLLPDDGYYWEYVARLRFALAIQPGLPPERAVALREAAGEAMEAALRTEALRAEGQAPALGVTADFDSWQRLLFEARGDDRASAGRYAEALADYERVTAVAPSASIWFKQARTRVMLNQPSEAAAAYHEALHWSGDDAVLIPATVARLGGTLAAVPDAEARLAALAAALGADFRQRIAPGVPDAAFLRGRASLCTRLAELPQAGAARGALLAEALSSEEALIAQPPLPPDEAGAARSRAALLLLRLGRDGEAAQRLHEALDGLPGDAPLRAEALAALDALVSAQPDLAARAGALRAIIVGP